MALPIYRTSQIIYPTVVVNITAATITCLVPPPPLLVSVFGIARPPFYQQVAGIHHTIFCLTLIYMYDTARCAII